MSLQLLTMNPDFGICTQGLFVDLLHGPCLEIHLALGINFFAFSDLPGIAICIGDKGVCVIEI